VARNKTFLGHCLAFLRPALSSRERRAAAVSDDLRRPCVWATGPARPDQGAVAITTAAAEWAHCLPTTGCDFPGPMHHIYPIPWRPSNSKEITTNHMRVTQRRNETRTIALPRFPVPVVSNRDAGSVFDKRARLMPQEAKSPRCQLIGVAPPGT